MDNIFSILNLNKEVLDAFPHQANLISDRQLDRTFALNQKKLKLIEDSMLSDTSIAPADRSIEKVMERVRTESVNKSSHNSEWSFHDLRTVSYYLTLLHGDDVAFDYAISLLSSNWRNLYFNGLVFYLLNGWISISVKYKEKVCALIQKQLNAYNETNKKYLSFKNHSNFFDPAGPLRLAALIKAKKDNIENAPLYLGFKPKSITLPFYSDVIVNYFKDHSVDFIDEFEKVNEIHELDRTKKLVLANLVELTDKEGNEIQQTMVGKFSERILGDISLNATWAPFNGASDEDIKKLNNAKNLVNSWYARKVVDVFFERCVQDPNRKQFWLNYVPYLRDFRIVGSLAIKGLVESDSRLSGLVDKFFVQTKSLKAQTSALVFRIKDKLFVEFSDLGSLYIYEEGFEPCERVFKVKQIPSGIDSLKMPNYGKFIDFNWYSEGEYNRALQKWVYKDHSTYYGEGRLPHNGNWQLRVYAWLKRVLHISLVIEEYEKDMPKIGEVDIHERFATISKPMSNGCRVVLDGDYFYLFSSRSGETYPLGSLHWEDDRSGSIWLKSGKNEELTAVYSCNGHERFIATLEPNDVYVSVRRQYSYYDEHFYIH